MKLRPPYWFCCGWWSPWCILDVLSGCRWRWICDRHDDAITKEIT